MPTSDLHELPEKELTPLAQKGFSFFGKPTAGHQAGQVSPTPLPPSGKVLPHEWSYLANQSKPEVTDNFSEQIDLLTQLLGHAMEETLLQAGRLHHLQHSPWSYPLICVGLHDHRPHEKLEIGIQDSRASTTTSRCSLVNTKALIKSAIQQHNPVIYRLRTAAGMALKPPFPPESITPPHKAILLRQGSDITLVSYGNAFRQGLAAAQLLSEAGIEAELVGLHWQPVLDETALLTSLGKTGRLLVIQEHSTLAAQPLELARLILAQGISPLAAPLVCMDIRTMKSSNWHISCSERDGDIQAIAEVGQCLCRRIEP